LAKTISKKKSQKAITTISELTTEEKLLLKQMKKRLWKNVQQYGEIIDAEFIEIKQPKQRKKINAKNS
jgi:hypothetical protein